VSVALDVKVVVIGDPLYNGINELVTDKKNFLIYPNPAKSGFFVSSLSGFQTVSIMIFDSRGSLVRSENGSGLFPGRKEINTQSLPDGLYYVAVTSEGKREIHKLIITR
jgi:hypothetical protein